MDLLNLVGEESIDRPDLTFALNDVPTELLRELTDGVLQGTGNASIFSGFVPRAAAAAGPVTIGTDGVANTALLGTLSGARQLTGVLSAGGPSSVSIDVSTYAAGTYGIYVRFTRLESAPQSRSVWSGVDLAETSRMVNTRLAGLWQARIENPPPGPEWLRIGDAIITAAGSGQGSTVTVVDKRPLYFEGSYAAGYRPTWGSAADRGSRQVATIGNFQTMIDALKQCIVDVKGRGLVDWTSPYVAGLNVGTRFAATDVPVGERAAVGDFNFYLQGSAVAPSINFDIASYFIYSRLSSLYQLTTAGNTVAAWTNNGWASMGNVPGNPRPMQPLTMWNLAPSGRMAQFAHDSGTVPASVSIGNTGGTGGRVDFATPSLSDFTSAFWSIETVFGDSGVMRLKGLGGTGLQISYLGGGMGNATLLQGQFVTVSSGNNVTLSTPNGRTVANALTVGGRPFNPAGTAYLTLTYYGPGQGYTSSGAAISRAAFDYDNGGSDGTGAYHVDLPAALPNGALIFLTAQLYDANNGNGANPVAIGHMVSNGGQRITVRMSAGINSTFNLCVLYGS